MATVLAVQPLFALGRRRHMDSRSGETGLWSDGSAWSTGSPPGPSDDAAITAPGSYTVTVNAPATADNVILASSQAVLDLQSSLTLSGIFSLVSGTLEITNNGALVGGTLDITGGDFAVDGNGSNTLSDVAVTGSLAYNGGYLVLNDGTSVSGSIDLTNASIAATESSSTTPMAGAPSASSTPASSIPTSPATISTSSSARSTFPGRSRP
jgi:hypothetical protein